ncbi:NAD-dependent epimerase/dehydratase family protein [Microlunatus parietis]|uniref:dTDP-L-rhamnose 4-epimerase n=1 Tax=Microlunatus parietis TaxID=682979 RepID=A0A7Y9LFC4_9ACTN|nr:NAD-dependent epimerase/dehydratase family protein [Microlunatus parietis]NYE73981.1 dTDP-L-rhamnose 4-epimerase [Microlunatus parietis]
MRVLVTGAAGFIGSTIMDRLRATGHAAVGLDLLLPKAHPAAAPPPWADPELIIGDLRDPEVVDRALAGVDAVCHQAAMVGVGVTVADLPDYTAHNLLGTATLLAGMARAGVRRLVLASSMVIYGPGGYRCPADGAVRPLDRRPEDLAAGRYEPRCPHCSGDLVDTPVGEDAPADPQNTYAVTKHGQELLAASWARETGAAVTALRYHNVYGPRLPRDTPYAGVAAIFRSALAAGSPPRVYEDGRQRRDFVHVHDVARANQLALERLDADPGHEILPLNIASGEPHTVAELAEVLSATLAGPPPIIVGGGRATDARHIVASPTRARTVLGFTARIRFAEGIAGLATD